VEPAQSVPASPGNPRVGRVESGDIPTPFSRCRAFQSTQPSFAQSHKYTLQVVSNDVILLFGSGQRTIAFALSERLSEAFIAEQIWLASDGILAEVTGRNGVEPLALQRLREGVTLLLHDGGSIAFGDHDYRSMVWLRRVGDRTTGYVDLPSEDLWEVPLGDMTDDDLRRVLSTIDEAGERFGPLTVHCSCGEPPLSWYPNKA
jgi:hypothetical protein